ncbi:MAG: helix-turn-helix transcriptional regulator [Siculibacillus sp.]|nr:helix-turn-helix transcriptional regulator [Siculibacillus sp.]
MNGYDEAIEAIYAAAFGGGAWNVAIDRLCAAVGSNGLIVNPVRLDRPGMLLFSDNLATTISDYERDWRHRDLRIRVGLGQGIAGGMVSERTLGISDEVRDRDPFYQEFLRPLDMECFAAYLFHGVDGQMYSISAQRERGYGDFAEDELARIAGLGRHLVRALDLAPRAARAVADAGSLVAGFEDLGHGLMAIDRRGRVEALNPTAERAMLRGFEGTGRAGHGWLRPLGDPVFERFVAAVVARLAGGPMVEPVMIERHDGPRLLFQMLPMVAATDGAAMGEPASAVISIYDLTAIRSASVEDLLARSGLTAGEAKVAARIGSGLSPRDSAAALGLTESTVRSVLKTVFGKLGLRKQSELAVLVSRLRAVRLDGE